MLINQSSLRSLFVGFKTHFQTGLNAAPSLYQQVAMTVTSTTAEEEYGWLGQFPNMREWIGDRVVHGVSSHGYTIRNKPFELTIGVPRTAIEDDTVGLYAPMFQSMGEATATHPDDLVFGLLKEGFSKTCYDGQYFFDTDHPVLDANGKVTSVANTDGGSGPGWYLLDLSRVLRPILYQQRKKPTFVAKDAETDDNVFNRAEYLYGVDARDNVGFGLWQLAWGSRQSLDKAHYKLARESLMGLKGDHGRPLAIRPTHLLVPPSLEGQALEILNAERDSAGATNVYKNTAQVLVCPWLA